MRSTFRVCRQEVPAPVFVLVVLLLAFAPSSVCLAAGDATIRLIDDKVVVIVTLEDNPSTGSGLRGKTLTLTSKPIRIAPGTYFVKSIRVLKKDEKGRVWEIRGAGNLGTMQTIAVAPGQEKVVDPGPPLSVRMWARQGDPPKDDEVAISFTVHGQYNEGYYPGAFLGRRRPPTPVFRLVAEDGKVLHQDRFNLSEQSGQCRYTWRYPRGFRGKYKVDIRCAFGPFELKNEYADHLFEVK